MAKFSVGQMWRALCRRHLQYAHAGNWTIVWVLEAIQTKIAKIITTLAFFCPLFAPCPLPIPLLSDCLWRNEWDRHSWMFTFKAHTKASVLLRHKTVAWQVMNPPFSSSLLGSLRSKTKLIDANEWSSMLSETHQPVLVSDLWFTGK